MIIKKKDDWVNEITITNEELKAIQSLIQNTIKNGPQVIESVAMPYMLSTISKHFAGISD